MYKIVIVFSVSRYTVYKDLKNFRDLEDVFRGVLVTRQTLTKGKIIEKNGYDFICEFSISFVEFDHFQTQFHRNQKCPRLRKNAKFSKLFPATIFRQIFKHIFCPFSIHSI